MGFVNFILSCCEGKSYSKITTPVVREDRYHTFLFSLATLMQNLNLFAEEEYVELMRAKMDSEGLGIILIHQVLYVQSSFISTVSVCMVL